MRTFNLPLEWAFNLSTPNCIWHSPKLNELIIFTLQNFQSFSNLSMAFENLLWLNFFAHVTILAWYLFKRYFSSHPFDKHLSPKHPPLLLHQFDFVVVFYRKMIKQNVQDATILIKWEACSFLRTRMFEAF